MGALAITPETTVGALLEAHPDLEAVLLEHAPAFGALKNPVLRRTVAEVATLGRVASMAGVDLGALVNALRRSVGQPEADWTAGESSESGGGDAPAWVREGRTTVRFDADEMLARNEHPVGPMRSAVKELGAGEVVMLKSSFRPVPLVQTFEADEECLIWCAPGPDGGYVTYAARRSSR